MAAEKKQITPNQKLTVTGMIALLHQRREALDAAEKAAENLLRDLGAEDTKDDFATWRIQDAVQESTYEHGDVVEATEWVIKTLNLEVEE